MNYQRIYEQLTAKDMIADYTEKHHIIPRCMGGTNDPSNLVRLTPEAHYVAHQLLVKIYPTNHKLVYAAVMMSSSLHHRNNKIYSWLKRKNSIIQTGKSLSSEHKAKISNSLKGKCKSNEHKIKVAASKQFISDESRAKMSSASKGKPKSNTHKANLSSANKGILQPVVICPHCNKLGGIRAMKRYHFNNCKYKG